MIDKETLMKIRVKLSKRRAYYQRLNKPESDDYMTGHISGVIQGYSGSIELIDLYLTEDEESEDE